MLLDLIEGLNLNVNKSEKWTNVNKVIDKIIIS